jgi:hypothetical protein
MAEKAPKVGPVPLRDFFATAVVHALLVNPPCTTKDFHEKFSPTTWVSLGYEWADAMLKERKRKGK